MDAYGSAQRGCPLAYREFGDGDTTLVWIPGWFSNVEMYDDPATPQTAVIAQLSEAMRIVVWDKRGTGLSDPATTSRRSTSAWMISMLFSTPPMSIVRRSSVSPKGDR